ncbi:glycosyltransferase family 2 protein [Albidovulum sediminis]|uniref:Glycosyltransferase family 2 protein n=1 Tax=Albidovulum sediminis TaxID=3066345 RepID=A0ABT2NUT2_9RHOB|nr:glycosyltransferase family 2 protein [Defluviimonas sediminis]MCT8331354.1 glycosyltransferase family 2 protein [Defluviimonas sediminis]
MTGMLPVSVIVVSRHRPTELALCLAGIRRQDHPNFELIVVADPAAAATCPVDAKSVLFDEANIAEARNRGLAVAAGDVVAFIDDDAVPEPRWLSRLTAPFADSEVSAAGGFVIGRNGISHQWNASVADRHGRSVPLEVDLAGVSVLQGAPGRAIRTEGTNCAFRRSTLAEVGGFDPTFRFYLDETDLNMRLAERGLKTAIVPRARVHHAYAASDRRRADRTPTDLTEIGASQAVFLRKHAPETEHVGAMGGFRAEQERRIQRLLRSGSIDGEAAARLLETLDRGIAEGMRRPLGRLAPLPGTAPDFLPLPAGNGRVHVSAGWTWQSKALSQAARARGESETAVVLLFSPTARYHRLRFTGTHWEQRGGLFGKSDRSDPLFRFWRRKWRFNREVKRLDF